MTTNARLRAFVAVADSGSVRAAARQLFVTESSVSAAIAALVREVGVPLIERDGRGVRLTPAGERYASMARTILGLHDEAIVAARAEAGPERGLLRLAAVTTAGEHVLPEVLASFRARYPDMALRLEVAPRDQVWPMLEHHEVDLVVAGRPPEGVGGRVRAIKDNVLVAVGPPELADGFDPSRATWLMREAGSGTRSTCMALLAEFDSAPPTMTLGSSGAVVAGAVVGLGVTLVSRDAVGPKLAAGSLVELAMPGLPLSRPWHAVSRPEFSQSAQLLVDHLISDVRGVAGRWRAPG